MAGKDLDQDAIAAQWEASMLSEDPEEGRRRFYDAFDCLQPDDIAEAIMFVLGAPQRMDVTYMEIVPTDQSYGGSQFHPRAR